MLDRWKRLAFGQPFSLGVRGSLTGRYDVRGDRLTGWVNGRPIHGDGRLVVEAKRYQEVLASCVAVPDISRHVQTFAFAIDNRFSTAELINETVVIAARNARGDTGILNLEGATQLDLIREYFAAPAVTILDLDFTFGGNAHMYLGAGWGTPERDFTWSDGSDSYVTFKALFEPGPYLLRTISGAFVHPPEVTTQSAQIFINDVESGSIEFRDGNNMQFSETKIDGAILAVNETTILRFRYQQPGRPCDFFGSSSDRRLLGCRFKSLKIVRLLPPNQLEATSE